jgi:DNA-binding beta-propeller fold protein YncE
MKAFAFGGKVSQANAFACIAVLALAAAEPAGAADTAPLTLEAKIPLGDVTGRIDHLAYDAARQRLYVAELGNDTIGVVDLKAQRVLRTVSGFDEPQGIGYDAGTDTVYVANGGDGTVRMFGGAEFSPIGNLALGSDADNVRIDRDAHRVYVGYGDGALAVIDSTTRKRIADIPLKGHPESFQLDPESDLIFVNVPDASQIAVVSREKNQQVSAWSTGRWRANYPLSIDPQSSRAFVVFRSPARIQLYEIPSGRTLGGIDVCSDSDDLFVDAKRHRVYVICGQGVVDSLDASNGKLVQGGRFVTSEGSRTGLFVPELDRLLVAIRATHDNAAAIWVLRPSP